MTAEAPPPPTDLPLLRASLARWILRLALAVAIAYGIHLFLNWSMDLARTLPPGPGLAMETALVALALLAYAALIAIPFVPGIEIGLSLIVMRGADIAVPVYLATVLGLSLAYLAGRLLPYPWLRRVLADLHMRRACALLDRLEPLSDQRRLVLLRRELPRRLGALAVNYRYLLLAGLVNLPGNVLIGGGGGICLVAGLTRLFRPRATLITIALAVLPFPLVVWIWGPGIFG